MKEFRLDLKIRNNLLVQRREELCLSPKQFSEKAKISYALYLRYENCLENPLKSPKGPISKLKNPSIWKESAVRIADFHGVSPEKLWPDSIMAVKKTHLHKCVSTDEMKWLTGGNAPQLGQLEFIKKREIQELLNAQINSLSDVEQHVLIRRFRDDAQQYEIAEELKLTKSSIGQIEARALSKLSCHKQRRKLLELQHPDIL